MVEQFAGISAVDMSCLDEVPLVFYHKNANHIGAINMQEKIVKIGSEILQHSQRSYSCSFFETAKDQTFHVLNYNDEQNPIFVGMENSFGEYGLVVILDRLEGDDDIDGRIAYNLAKLPFSRNSGKIVLDALDQFVQVAEHRYSDHITDASIDLMKAGYLAANAYELAEIQGHAYSVEQLLKHNVEEDVFLLDEAFANLVLLQLAEYEEEYSKTLINNLSDYWKPQRTNNGEEYIRLAEKFVNEDCYKTVGATVKFVFDNF